MSKEENLFEEPGRLYQDVAPLSEVHKLFTEVMRNLRKAGVTKLILGNDSFDLAGDAFYHELRTKRDGFVKRLGNKETPVIPTMKMFGITITRKENYE